MKVRFNQTVGTKISVIVTIVEVVIMIVITNMVI